MPYRRRIRLSFATVCYPGDGTLGQSAPYAGENLIMAWPPDNIDLPALLLLHVPGGTGSLLPRCSPRLGAAVGCIRGNLRLCGVKPSVEVDGTLLRSCGPTAWVRGGPIDDVRPLPLRRGSWSCLAGCVAHH
jgi:hypothetical protein